MENLLQPGVELVGMLALVTLVIREVFSYLKTKNDIHDPEYLKTIYQELQTMNSNHLNCIERAIKDGNQELIKTLNDNNRQSIEILGRIDGKLSNRK